MRPGRLRRRRWPLALALVGVLLGALALGLGLRGDERPSGPQGPVQVGGHGARDLLRVASTPVLAVDPGDHDRVLLANRVERPRFSCEVFASADGGATWEPSRFRMPDAGERCYAPQVAFGPDGRAHLLLTMLEGRGNEPYGGFLYESGDGGRSFGPPRPVLPRYSFQSSIAVADDGTLRLTYVRGNEFSRHATFGFGPPPTPVVVRRVGADGALGPPRQASRGEGAREGGPVTAIGPRGEIYVLYWDYGDDVFDYHAFPGRYRGRHRLMLARSHDGGRSFERHVVEPAVVPAGPFLAYLPPLPALAVDGRSGALHAAWADGRSGGGDVLLRTSDDGGAGWTAPRRLFGSPAEERTPALASTADGRLLAAAYRITRRGRAEVAVRASADGGRSFSAPAALTPTPFDAGIAPRLASRSDEIDLGSRIALRAEDGPPLAAWADTRTGRRDTGKVDIMLARVPEDLPSARPLPAAAAAPPPARSLLDRRLSGECRPGPRFDEQASPVAVVRSFLSALGEGDARRAYGYLDRRWRTGRGPVPVPHPFAAFAARYGSVTCARLAEAESYDRSEDGRWATLRVWFALRRDGGPTRLGYGLFWTHSEDGTPPWRVIGFFTEETDASGGRGRASR